VVRTPAGNVEVDPSAKAAGRGAYVCARPECWADAIKRDRLAHALRTTISPTDREALERHASQLTAGVPA
ncbi:MAG TPA: YlxR family protein, partial [Dehalococcoidia bacterium]